MNLSREREEVYEQLVAYSKAALDEAEAALLEAEKFQRLEGFADIARLKAWVALKMTAYAAALERLAEVRQQNLRDRLIRDCASGGSRWSPLGF